MNTVMKQAALCLIPIFLGFGCNSTSPGLPTSAGSPSIVNSSELNVHLGLEEIPGVDSIQITVDSIVLTSTEGEVFDLLSSPVVLTLSAATFSAPELLLHETIEGNGHVFEKITIELSSNIEVTENGATHVRKIETVAKTFNLQQLLLNDTAWLTFRLDLPYYSTLADSSGTTSKLELSSTAKTADIQYAAFNEVFENKTVFMLELSHVIGEFEVLELSTGAYDVGGWTTMATFVEVRTTDALKGTETGQSLVIRGFPGAAGFADFRPGDTFLAGLELLDDGYYQILGAAEGKIEI